MSNSQVRFLIFLKFLLFGTSFSNYKSGKMVKYCQPEILKYDDFLSNMINHRISKFLV